MALLWCPRCGGAISNPADVELTCPLGHSSRRGADGQLDLVESPAPIPASSEPGEKPPPEPEAKPDEEATAEPRPPRRQSETK